MTEKTQTQELTSILTEMDQSWEAFLEELRRVPPDDFTADPGDGEWSVKRQVEHAIGSEVYFASLIIHALGTGSGRQWERDRLVGVLEEVRAKTLGRLATLPSQVLDKAAAHPDEGEYAIRDVLTGPLTRHPRMHLEYVQKVRDILKAKQ